KERVFGLACFASALAIAFTVMPARVEAGPLPRPGRIQGLVTAINPAGSLTITTVAGSSVSFRITPLTVIERNGARTLLAGLRVGDRGQVLFDARTLIAVKVETVGTPVGALRPEAQPGDDRGGRRWEAQPNDDRGGKPREPQPGDDRGGNR